MDVWRGQNHQFRVSLKNIPPQIELYRLSYKREEYRNLYARRNTSYEEADLCPVSKRVRDGEVIHVHRTSNPEIDNDLLEEFISNAKDLAPQQIVYEILNYTIKNQIKTKDDMTVIVAKLVSI